MLPNTRILGAAQVRPSIPSKRKVSRTGRTASPLMMWVGGRRPLETLLGTPKTKSRDANLAVACECGYGSRVHARMMIYVQPCKSIHYELYLFNCISICNRELRSHLQTQSSRFWSSQSGDVADKARPRRATPRLTLPAFPRDTPTPYSNDISPRAHYERTNCHPSSGPRHLQ